MRIFSVEDGVLLPGGDGLTDEQARALDLDRHVLVAAGAGSGKTRTLTRRYLRILGSFAWEASEGGRGPGPEAILVSTRFGPYGPEPRLFNIWPGLFKHHHEFGDGRTLCFDSDYSIPFDAPGGGDDLRSGRKRQNN